MWIRTGVRRRFPFVVATAVVLAAALGSPGARAADAGQRDYVPGQFIAKTYTEALGRLPTQRDWTRAAAGFAKPGCSESSVAALSRQIYTSREFLDLGYDNASRLLALYRGVLNREPDAPGFDHWLNRLGGGTPWRGIVDVLLDAPEFTGLVPKICSGAIDSAATSYNFGGQKPLRIFTTSHGFTGTEAELQIALNRAKPAGTVALAQRALVVLTHQLTIPHGVTLTTAGRPDTAHYANMGRLVRGGPFNHEMVSIDDGAKVRNVWVDGARGTPTNWAPGRANVRLNGGTGTTLTEDKISDTAGPSSVFVLGAFDRLPCRRISVTKNLITAYSSSNYQTSTWTDGVSVTCGSTDVSHNQIVDTSDVAIVLYRASGPEKPVAQASQVYGNQILSAGNSMYGAVVADPLFVDKGYSPAAYDFTGSAISGNTFWSSPNTHFDIGLGAGTRAWFGTNTNSASGTTITGNTTGPLSARVQIGIAVAGMQEVTVSDNALRLHHPASIGRCPRVNIAVDETTASGTFHPAPGYTGAFDGCVGHYGKKASPTWA